MKCVDCGAHNPDTAAWCSQCHRRVDAGAASVATGPAAVAAPTPRVTPAADEPAAEHRGVRVVGETVEWRCGRCAAWSELAATVCTTCGASRRGFGERAPAGTGRVGDGGVVGASLLLPGLGHVVAGHPGTGLARAVLAVVWVGGAVVLLVGSPTAGAAGLVLALAAAVLWALTLVDAVALVRGSRRQVLGTRGLGVLVVVVSVALLGVLTGAAAGS